MPSRRRPDSAIRLVSSDDSRRNLPCPGPAGLTSNFSAEGYLRAVRRAIEYIHAGDVFQVNLAQRLLYPAHDDAVSLYLRLRRRNPATFAGYFDLGAFRRSSARRPSGFSRCQDRQVEARPIKGTRQRTARPEADLFAGDELLQSEKDRAENVMIVDLLRNDLSRVCRAGQRARHAALPAGDLRIRAAPGFGRVRHLAEGRTALDLLRAAFPGGSITGAPKVRAMEIIAELEPTARGAYCGALGYLGFDGALDTSILIRTITAGAADGGRPRSAAASWPNRSAEREYEETWHKARPAAGVGSIRTIAAATISDRIRP